MELKKCRFCGGEALMYEIPAHKHVLVNMPDYEGGVFIECTQCSAGISAYSIEERKQHGTGGTVMREILFRGQTRRYGEKVRIGDGKKLPSQWVYGGIFAGTGDFSVIYGAKTRFDTVY